MIPHGLRFRLSVRHVRGIFEGLETSTTALVARFVVWRSNEGIRTEEKMGGKVLPTFACLFDEAAVWHL